MLTCVFLYPLACNLNHFYQRRDTDDRDNTPCGYPLLRLRLLGFQLLGWRLGVGYLCLAFCRRNWWRRFVGQHLRMAFGRCNWRLPFGWMISSLFTLRFRWLFRYDRQTAGHCKCRQLPWGRSTFGSCTGKPGRYQWFIHDIISSRKGNAREERKKRNEAWVLVKHIPCCILQVFKITAREMEHV